MSSHLQSLGVANVTVHQLLDRATNLSLAAAPDDVIAVTSRLLAATQQVVLNISSIPISADHVTEIYRTAETGRQTAQLTLNATQRARYDIDKLN